MDKERIKEIIRQQGYRPQFRRVTHHSAHTKGRVKHEVYAWKGRMGRSLGSFEMVAQMDEEELRMHIEARFAQGAAQKARR
jgi:hypothetical protein